MARRSMLRGRGVFPEALDQVLHHQAQTAARTQVLMQHQPHVCGQTDPIRQDGGEISVATGDALLDKNHHRP
jgi:hypothetical protein